MSQNDKRETPAPTLSSGEDEENKGLSLEAATALAGASYEPESFGKRFGSGLVHLLVKVLFFLLGVLIDILKGLWAILRGIFVGLYKGILGIGRLAVKVHRIFYDVDIWGKLTFLINGLGNLVRKQWLDGFVFLGVQLLFNVFMFVPIKGVMIGYSNLYNFIHLNDGAKYVSKYGQHFWVGAADARLSFINGIFTILVVIAFLFFYSLAIRSMNDNYQIVRYTSFRAARENAIKVLRHKNDYEEDLSKLSRLKIKRLMKEKYGFDELSARYISQVDFKHAIEKEPTPISKAYFAFAGFFYRGYDACRKWCLARYEWTSPLERFLDYQRKPIPNAYGYELVLGKKEAELLAFRHTYDKYNDYFSKTRDYRALVAVLKQPGALLDSILLRDQVSVRNGLTPKKATDNLKVRDCVSSVVGVFALPLPLAKKATKIALHCLSVSKKTVGGDGLETRASELVMDEGRLLEAKMGAFERSSRQEMIADEEGLISAYRDYANLRPLFDQGPSAFKGALIESRNVSLEHAKLLYKDYAHAIKKTKDDPEQIRAFLEQKAARLEEGYGALVETYPFHGQPTGFRKRVKEFGDEKFAITVLSIPVLAAVLTCIIPLLCSVFVAFTNWDQYHTNNKFVWSNSAFTEVLNLFAGDSDTASYGRTFFHLLKWTIIWAFFATFTNYFGGIILALFINRKSIKLKKMWRTIFVITIAIPQFISLLAINLLLSSDGAVNTWLLTQDWYTQGLSQTFGWGAYSKTTGAWVASPLPFLGGKNAGANDSFIPKLTVILANMWVGIPYTMLSTSGILMNIPEDLYESSRIDGAGPVKQLFSITMPYVFFVTGPALLTQFIGNINNFNVIYFLTGGEPSAVNSFMVTGAGETDLLITWLYKLTVNYKDYSIGAVIGILVFAVCAFFSLIIYGRLGSVKNEEEFQ
jgi:ABC-type sugar transport system permease subunit